MMINFFFSRILQQVILDFVVLLIMMKKHKTFIKTWTWIGHLNVCNYIIEFNKCIYIGQQIMIKNYDDNDCDNKCLEGYILYISFNTYHTHSHKYPHLCT